MSGDRVKSWRRHRRIGRAAVVALAAGIAAVGVGGSASAASGTRSCTGSNASQPSQTATINWSNSFSSCTASGNTVEVSNVARLRTQMAYNDTSNVYREADTTWKTGSTAPTSRAANSAFWTKHSYDGDTSSNICITPNQAF